MTQQEVLDLINQFIVTNGNNEITANVLNPILEEMVNQPNLLIGILSQLNTSDQTNLVNAINEVYNMFGSVSDAGIRIYEGTSDPNTTPPAEFKIGDFYIQKDLLNNPVKLFQYNGFGWFPPLGIFDIIDDSITANDSTWSSEKIVDEIETAVSGAGTVTEVTGVSGEITVANGTTAPVIGIDSAYTDSKQDTLTEENVGEFMDLDLPTKVTPSLTDTLLSRDLATNNAVEVTIGSVVSLANTYADSKVQDTITDGVTDKAPSENAVFDALDLKQDKKFRISSTVDSAVLTGGTPSTPTIIVSSILIPANSVKTGDIVTFRARMRRTVPTSTNTSVSLAIAPTSGITNPVTGALTNIYKYTGAVYSGTNTVGQSKHELNVKNGSNLTEVINITMLNDDSQSIDFVNLTNTDWSVNQYLYIILQNGQSNTASYLSFWEFYVK